MRGTDSSRIRIRELSEDIFEDGKDAPQPEREWPVPDYYEVANACVDDQGAYEQLLRICEDLESTISLAPGPGSLPRVASVPLEMLQPLAGRCWREILLDDEMGRLTLLGIRNYAHALKSKRMDSSTRLMGCLIHSIAVVRLSRQGMIEEDQDRHNRDQVERKKLLAQPYLLASLARVLQP